MNNSDILIQIYSRAFHESVIKKLHFLVSLIGRIDELATDNDFIEHFA